MATKTRRERFIQVAESRVNKVIKTLDSLEKCSNTYNYEYNEEDVKKLYGAIKSRVESLKQSFDKGLSKSQTEFKF